MLRSLNDLRGYNLKALDGTIGNVSDFYFDDRDWAIRYLVANTAKLLPGRKVLLAPEALGEPDWASRLLPVNHTRDQVRHSPGIDLEKPVSRQEEASLHDHYLWVPYWAPGFPSPAVPTPMPVESPDGAPPEEGEHDPHLRSTQELRGYRIACLDGEAGHVEDFIAQSGDWRIKMLVVDTRNWLPGKHVLLATDWVERVDWAGRAVHLGIPRMTIQDAPPFDPAEPVNDEFEERLYDYFGRPSAGV